MNTLTKRICAAMATVVAAAGFAAVVGAASPEGIECIEGLEGFNDKENYQSLFDNDVTTKWCVGSSYSYVIWKMPEAVSVTGYTITTANDNAEYPGRNPLSWVLTGSTDGENWNEIHYVEADDVLQDVNYEPFTFTLDSAAPAYQYYQLEIEDVVGGGTMQMSGFDLIYEGAPESEYVDPEVAELTAKFNAGTPYSLNAGTPAGLEALAGTAGFSDKEGFASLFDNDPTTKWCNNGQEIPAYVEWKMPEAVAITGYIITTANDNEGNPGRNPLSWVLSGSNDGTTWTAIDTVTGDATLQDVNYTPFTFTLANAAPAYQYYRFEITEVVGGATMQVADFNLVYEGSVLAKLAASVDEILAARNGEAVPAPAETTAPETEPETTAPETEPETTAPETEPETTAPETEPETTAPETEPETVAAPAETEAPAAPAPVAPQTFDAGIIAAVAATVSACGYAIAKKRK